IKSDPEYSHLEIVPCSAHAEKALKNADEKGAVEYTPGDDSFEIEEELPDEKREGLDEIQQFLDEYGGTGVQQTLERALFDELGL
ncbi:MAG: GTPase, partial [Candidatus Nanohaloarchaea archaeon]